MKKVFVRFLKDRRSYSAFVRNYNSDRNFRTVNEYLSGDWVDRANLISSAFTWHLTDQGGKFWAELDRCWKAELIALKHSENL